MSQAHWIVVNRHRIAANRKSEASLEPVLRVSKGKSGAPDYGCRVAILDAAGNAVAHVIYDHENPVMPCGARVAIEAVHGARIVS